MAAGIRLAASGRSVDHLDVATLNGKHFKVKPRMVVLAAGGMESARLLLVSNDVVKPGVGNENDLVGRFFADAEALYSYEGTYQMQNLIVGKAITGLSAFV